MLVAVQRPPLAAPSCWWVEGAGRQAMEGMSARPADVGLR
jgi:hypothetical protein